MIKNKCIQNCTLFAEPMTKKVINEWLEKTGKPFFAICLPFFCIVGCSVLLGKEAICQN